MPRAVAEDNNHGSEETPQPDFAQLSQSCRDFLTVAQDVLQDFNPRSDVLKDLPQLFIQANDIVDVCRRAKDDPRLDLKLLLCLACVDYEEYFQMVYFLHSLNHEQTLVIKADLPYADPVLASVTSVWRAADWYEREAHDLFGVEFTGHPNLVPLLLYDEFEGFPGRKEFPFYEYQEF